MGAGPCLFGGESRTCSDFAAKDGTEIFPDANAPLLRLRMRAPTGTRIEETERLVLRALDVLNREIGPGNVEITSDFLGLIPSSYPVDLIHLFTSGPQKPSFKWP